MAKFARSSRCVARTFSIEEAKQIADRFEAQGYETDIVENKRGSTSIYEVWAGNRADGFEVKGNKERIGPKILKTD